MPNIWRVSRRAAREIWKLGVVDVSDVESSEVWGLSRAKEGSLNV